MRGMRDVSGLRLVFASILPIKVDEALLPPRDMAGVQSDRLSFHTGQVEGQLEHSHGDIYIKHAVIAIPPASDDKDRGKRGE